MVNLPISWLVFASCILMGCTFHKSKIDSNNLDPLEDFNRIIFNFNYNILDYYVIHKTAIVWQHYIPKPVRNSLINFFNNLEEPATVVNLFLERKPYKAMIHFNRFFLNTILGMGGLIDVATMVNPKLIKETPRRFGNTLHYYGIGYGPYLQLPGYGGFTPREDIGGLVDNFYPILRYLTWWMLISKWLLEGLETRAQMLDLDIFLKNSQDPYAMIRTIYFQKHDFLENENLLISQNSPQIELLKNDLCLIDIQQD